MLFPVNRIPTKHIFTDKQSGKDFKRERYRSLRKRLKKDDVLVIKSIDRLERNYEDILDEWKYITKKINADIVVLGIPLWAFYKYGSRIE